MSITPASTPTAATSAVNASTVTDAHQVVIFANVDGCGAGSPIGVRGTATR